MLLADRPYVQCDQIWRFIELCQLLNAFGNTLFAQISHMPKDIFVKVTKSIIFLVKSFLGNFYRHLAIFSGHTAPV